MKKAIKIVGYTLLGLIVVLWGVQWWLGNKIEDIIEEKIYEESGGRIQAVSYTHLFSAFFPAGEG